MALSNVSFRYQRDSRKEPDTFQNKSTAQWTPQRCAVAGAPGIEAMALRFKGHLTFDPYDHCMQNILTPPAPTFDLDLAHELTGTDLDFVQNIKSNGFALATFTPHLFVLILALGAFFLNS